MSTEPDLAVDLRDERGEDLGDIDRVVEAAFAGLARSSHREHLIVRALRAADALAVSLVAVAADGLVGHCAASPVTISTGTSGWFGLGPVSVVPHAQNRRLGARLVTETLARLRAGGAAGCVVLGHADYYPRFGFARSPQLALAGYDGPSFFALSFVGDVPAGTVHYHAAFEA